MRDMLAPYVVKHQQLVLQDTPAADTDIKKLCPGLVFQLSLGEFIGCLCQYIKTALGKEHMNCLGNPNASNSNSFIHNPVATKPEGKCMMEFRQCIPGSVFVSW